MFAMANAQNHMNPFGFQPDMGSRGRGGRKNRGPKKGGARAPFSADGPVHDRSKSTIVIENIPEESFNEDMVRDFFSQFGSIQEVSMQPYKHLAIVKYDKWGSANAAYKSPKVIFDNRFVKVFWYKDESDMLPASVPVNGGNWTSDPSASADGQELEPEIDMEEFQRRQGEAQKHHQERELKRAELERQRIDLERQQQELLARHREENEKLQRRLTGQSSEGGDAPSSGTDMLRAKLAMLEQEAKILGIDPDAEDDTASSYHPPRGGYRGRGAPRGRGYAPRGRGSARGRGGNMHAAYAQYSIDNRPKKLAVTGVDFTAAEKDEVLRHFLLVRSPLLIPLYPIYIFPVANMYPEPWRVRICRPLPVRHPRLLPGPQDGREVLLLPPRQRTPRRRRPPGPCLGVHPAAARQDELGRSRRQGRRYDGLQRSAA